MASVIVMPKLSPTMEEGVLLKWHKKEGDKISPGDVIAEVETDKANMDFPLEDEGTLLKLLVAEGETVKLGAPVGVLGEAGEGEGAIAAALAGAGDAAKATPAEAAPPTEKRPAPSPGSPGGPHARQEGSERVRASPLARKIASERGVDLHALQGSGPGGRVVRRDVESAESAPASSTATAATSVRRAPAPVLRIEGRGDETAPLSQMRKTVARRLVEAKQTVPHFYLTMDARADALWAFYEELKAAPKLDGGETKVTVNDLILKATAVALTRVPRANASFTDGGIVRHGRVDIGVAVAIEDGLITPVVRDADVKSVGAIAREVKDLAARARLKKLKPEEYTGGTFSVSNLGPYGVREFAAIINPPESGILAVGALEKRPVVVSASERSERRRRSPALPGTPPWRDEETGEDGLEIQRVVTLTLSCDHRVVDGALGAELLREIVRVVEHPSLMVL